MKYTLLIMILLALGVGLLAHPAGNVRLKYTAADKVLTVNFDHKVKNAQDHYINTILIKLNGLTIISQTSNTQDSLTGGEFLYKIPLLVKGDEIEVITECNKSGRKSSKMVLN
ncbi:MAG TPA: hypothetical protein PLA08_04030 [Candidatus Cloacimonadota bacterium]|nr:hypothetical protein [Candidatus Cloacimonadota bacterium]